MKYDYSLPWYEAETRILEEPAEELYLTSLLVQEGLADSVAGTNQLVEPALTAERK